MHAGGFADRKGFPGLARWIRSFVTLRVNEWGISKLMDCQFRFVLSDVGGCAIDVDTEDEYARVAEVTLSDKVFTLTYIHKHGSDVGVYRTREGAEDAAYGLALERAEEWDDKEATARFKAEDRDGAFDIFQEVEMEMAYGEILEVTETELRA